MFKLNLTRKQWIITAAFGFVWTVLSVIMIIFTIRNEREQTRVHLINQGRTTYWVISLVWAWHTDIGKMYAPVTGRVVPNEYMESADRVIETVNGHHLTRIIPVEMANWIGDSSFDDNIISIRLTSTSVINPRNKADEWETVALERLEKGEPEIFTDVYNEGDRHSFRYMGPVYMEKSCFECHSTGEYREGSIRGGLSLIMDASPSFAWLLRENIENTIISIVIWLAGLIGIIILMINISRRIGKELQNEKFRGVLEMAGAAAHELNQPLQIISGYAELIPMLDPDDQHSSSTMLEAIRKNIARLAMVTWKLNNITRYKTIDYVGDAKIVDIYKSAPDSIPGSAPSLNDNS